MARTRFVIPEIQRLFLSDGDWIDVKKRLGIAEAKRIESAIFRAIRGSENLAGRTSISAAELEVALDPSAAFLEKMECYIVDWSFQDSKGQPVEVTPAAIRALDPDTAEEIMRILNEFLDSEEVAKKDPFTSTNSALPSESAAS